MCIHARFGIDDGQHRSVGADHERGPLRWQESHPFHSELVQDLLLRIAQQGETQIIVLGEFALPINLISAHSHNSCAEFTELGLQVAEMLGFKRSTRRLGLDVEVQDQRSSGDKIGKRDLFPILIQGRKVLDNIANFHGSSPYCVPAL